MMHAGMEVLSTCE